MKEKTPMMRVLLLSTCAVALCGCDSGPPSADEHQQQVQAQTTAQADREVGMPAIKNWMEKRMVRDLYELRDKQISTFVYVQGIDGRLTCLGQAVGYGIPYAVQFSNPQRWVGYWDTEAKEGHSMPQAEPNGLFMPDNAEGTWLQMLNPGDGTVRPVYVEPRVTVSPFRLRGPAVAADCAEAKTQGSK